MHKSCIELLVSLMVVKAKIFSFQEILQSSLLQGPYF